MTVRLFRGTNREMRLCRCFRRRRVGGCVCKLHPKELQGGIWAAFIKNAVAKLLPTARDMLEIVMMFFVSLRLVCKVYHDITLILQERLSRYSADLAILSPFPTFDSF